MYTLCRPSALCGSVSFPHGAHSRRQRAPRATADRLFVRLPTPCRLRCVAAWRMSGSPLRECSARHCLCCRGADAPRAAAEEGVSVLTDCRFGRAGAGDAVGGRSQPGGAQGRVWDGGSTVQITRRVEGGRGRRGGGEGKRGRAEGRGEVEARTRFSTAAAEQGRRSPAARMAAGACCPHVQA